MSKNKQIVPSVIFVDCFNTIIFRKIKSKEVFKQWAKKLSEEYNIPWKKIYKLYNSINFYMCIKKLFTKFTLIEKFDFVLNSVYGKLVKKYPNLDRLEFIGRALELYIQIEQDSFMVNTDMINLLKEEKSAGKKIYLVSDFYCGSDIITKWFTHFNIAHIFDDIFSSADFDKEKATAKIYKLLLKRLELDPKKVIMYGDNLWSDVMMARACGMKSERIKNKYKG